MKLLVRSRAPNRTVLLKPGRHKLQEHVRSCSRSPGSLVSRGQRLGRCASALVVNVTLCFPDVILLETGLSFLGLGIQPPIASLGNMVGAGRDYLGGAWWIAAFPGLVIVVTTLCISLLGDWLRDRFDPTLR